MNGRGTVGGMWEGKLQGIKIRVRVRVRGGKATGDKLLSAVGGFPPQTWPGDAWVLRFLEPRLLPSIKPMLRNAPPVLFQMYDEMTLRK